MHSYQIELSKRICKALKRLYPRLRVEPMIFDPPDDVTLTNFPIIIIVKFSGYSGLSSKCPCQGQVIIDTYDENNVRRKSLIFSSKIPVCKSIREEVSHLYNQIVRDIKLIICKEYRVQEKLKNFYYE